MQTVVLSGTVETVGPVNITPHTAKDRAMARIRNQNGEEVLYIPGSTLRGSIRHGASRKVLEVLGPGASQLVDYAGLALGYRGKMDIEKSDVVDLEAIRAARISNPFMSTFGFWKFPGRMSCGHALTDLPGRGIISGARRNPLDDHALIQVMDAKSVEDFRNMLDGVREDVAEKKDTKEKIGKKIKASKEAASDTEKAAIRDEINALRAELDEKSGSNNISHPWDYEAIPPGTVMPHKIISVHTTAKELGVILAGLDWLSTLPLIGGHRARGCGEIKLSYTARLAGGEAIGDIEAGGFDPVRIKNASGLLAEADEWRRDAFAKECASWIEPVRLAKKKDAA